MPSETPLLASALVSMAGLKAVASPPPSVPDSVWPALTAGDLRWAANKSQLRGEQSYPAVGRGMQDNANWEEKLPPSPCASY